MLPAVFKLLSIISNDIMTPGFVVAIVLLNVCMILAEEEGGIAMAKVQFNLMVSEYFRYVISMT